ncbi:MAG: glycosyltransferase family 4 protein [Chloroflexota bacterium]|nr:glycosyltransferase family 4 protein [Chloroflexota bacterium]
MVSNAYYPADPRLRRQAEALRAHGYEVDVVCQRQPSERPEEHLLGVHVLRVGSTKYRGSSLMQYLKSNANFFVHALLTLSRIQVRYGYDAVQVYSMPEALIFTAILPRLLGVPLIYDAGDLTAELYPSKFGGRGGRLLGRLLRIQERSCLKFADLIVTVHEEYRQRLLARGVPSERLRITMNLPDLRLFETALEKPVPRSPDTFLLVHHGSLVARYGADIAIRAVDRLIERIPELRLRIYGDGDFRPDLEHLIAELSVGDRITLHAGYVPLENLLPLLAVADAAIVPHRADAFTDTILPNKLLEYLALGLPTIVTRTRTVLWHVPEDTVEYCEPNDVDEMVRAIERVWGDRAHRAELALRARAFSREHSWTTAAAAYCQAVDELIQRRRPTGAGGHA